MKKMEELLAATKLKALLKKEEEEKNKSKVCWIFRNGISKRIFLCCFLFCSYEFTYKNA